MPDKVQISFANFSANAERIDNFSEIPIFPRKYLIVSGYSAPSHCHEALGF
jgi:hypothetical protein